MPTDLEILRVAKFLQEWIENFDGLSEVPTVAVTITAYTQSIEIGAFLVYHSEEPPDDDMSLLGHCKEEFLKEARHMALFLQNDGSSL